ncbi:recombinase family protein [Microbacterium sp. NPDC090225]|uniref:recombinase family protein n=1 Tax=Microbacterium sp. NPDC090225 TaxID=3364207 RepID=UPI0038162124
MHTIHGYIRFAERNDDALDYRMDDLYDYGVDAENVVFDIGSDNQLRRLLKSVEPGDVLAIVDFTHFAPTSEEGRANLDELHRRGATLHIGDFAIEPGQPVSTFITEALLTAVDAGETRLGLEERGLASGMKVTDKADGQRRVGYTPTAEHGEVDALHRLGILGRNIIVGDRGCAIDHVATRGCLVVLDLGDLYTGPDDRARILAQLAKKSVLVEVGSVGLEWVEAA